MTILHTLILVSFIQNIQLNLKIMSTLAYKKPLAVNESFNNIDKRQRGIRNNLVRFSDSKY